MSYILGTSFVIPEILISTIALIVAIKMRKLRKKSLYEKIIQNVLYADLVFGILYLMCFIMVRLNLK